MQKINSRRWRLRMYGMCLAAVVISGKGHAGSLEPSSINLGTTSYLDGFGPVQPGWTYLGYYEYGSATHIEGNDGHDLHIFRSPKIAETLIISQVTYATDVMFFHDEARLGISAILPHINFDTRPTGDLGHDGAGFGDLTIGPYLQFNPVIRNGRPVFTQRIEFDLIAPIGKYDASKAVNQSSNFWSINPYWAATWLPTARTDVSWRLHYLYNFANHDPGDTSPSVSKTRAGQAVWINFAAAYAFTSRVHLGFNGYYFRQLTKDRWTFEDGTTTDGIALGDSGKDSVFAIGPGGYWTVGKNDVWNLNVYMQTSAKNQSRGAQVNLHWTHPF